MGQNYICPVVIVLGNIKRGTDLLGAETIYRVNKRVMVVSYKCFVWLSLGIILHRHLYKYIHGLKFCSYHYTNYKFMVLKIQKKRQCYVQIM